MPALRKTDRIELAARENTLKPGTEQAAGWGEIIAREHVPKLIVLGLAIWLHAANSMLTANTMPSAAKEIGGIHLISWTFSLYLTGSILAGAASSLLVSRYGLRNTMIRAALAYTLGCIICALAPSMPVVLAGRVLQGLGGGCLMATAYIAQSWFFPNRFVPRIIAGMSMVWMMAALCGPAIGGAFSTWGIWRDAYWVFAGQSVVLAVAVKFLLHPTAKQWEIQPEPLPIVRLGFLAASILMVSLAGTHQNPVHSTVILVLGMGFLVLFVIRDRRALRGRVLPLQVADFSHALANGTAMVFLFCLSIMSLIVYGPLILIEIHGLTPFTAGIIVMLESVAWGGAALAFSGIPPEREPLLIRCGGALVLAGLILTAWIIPWGPLWAIIVVAQIPGGGFGMMWGFIAKRIVGAAPKKDKDRASSLMPMTLQTGFAMGAALCGLIANSLGMSGEVSMEALRHIAFWVFAGFVPCAIFGNIAAWRFLR